MATMSSIFSAGGLDELKNHARSAWKAGIGERNANKRRLLGPFEAGAEVTVSAWTFDERVGATTHCSRIAGTVADAHTTM